jgi:hypothetical protein
MAWTAFLHLRAAGADTPRLFGVDRDLIAAGALALAAFGLLCRRSRSLVAASLLCGIAYLLSDRQMNGTLGLDALAIAPVAAAALFVCWPRLVEGRRP